MNKNEFLLELKSNLKKLPDYEIDKIVGFYEEAISDRIENGENEELAVEKMGSVDEISKEILVNIPMTKVLRNTISKRKNKKNGIWLVCLIAGFPIWFSLAIAGIAVLFSVYISLWAVIISLYAVLISLFAVALSGVLGFFISIYNGHLSQALALLGCGLFTAGLGILAVKPLNYLAIQLAKSLGLSVTKLKKLFITKQNQEGVEI